jgi:exosortase A-associated hydrolase 2
MNAAPTWQPMHLDVDGGRRFAMLHEPAGAPRGLVLHVHAWAEEMNKSRRMVALQARALAAAGWTVLVPDLYGCGDSDGDFGEATWARWQQDVAAAAAWLRQRHPAVADALWLWGHRCGALLAAEAAATLPRPAHLLLWQPAINGRAVLQQFLRLRMAADLQAGAGNERAEGSRGIVKDLLDDLAAGRPVEVAGYTICPELAAGLNKATLHPPVAGRRVAWLEMTRSAETALLPGSARVVDGWLAHGVQIDVRVVPGAGFWQSVEIEEAPALVAATVDALSDAPVREPGAARDARSDSVPAVMAGAA